MEGKRIDWLDTSRGLAFLMVIYSHLEFCNHDLMRYFSPVFLTTFFFVSGYLYKSNSSFMKVFEQRTRTLFIPFIIYGTLLIALRYLYTTMDELASFDTYFLQMLFQYEPESRFIWFIPALYVYSLLFYWIEKHFNSPRELLVASLLFFTVNYVLSYFFHISKLPYTLHTAGFGCAYMGFGKVYRHYETIIDKHLGLHKMIIVFISYILFVFVSPGISYCGSPYLVDSIVITIIGLSILIFASKRLKTKCKFLLFIGSNSLLYFCLHGKVYAILESLVHKHCCLYLLDNAMFCNIMGIALTFADAVILIIPIVIINRYIPFTIGRGYKLW